MADIIALELLDQLSSDSSSSDDERSGGTPPPPAGQRVAGAGSGAGGAAATFIDLTASGSPEGRPAPPDDEGSSGEGSDDGDAVAVASGPPSPAASSGDDFAAPPPPRAAAAAAPAGAPAAAPLAAAPVAAAAAVDPTEAKYLYYLRGVQDGKYRHRIGPNLAAVQALQASQGVTEYYAREHLRAVVAYEARVAYPVTPKARACFGFAGPALRSALRMLRRQLPPPPPPSPLAAAPCSAPQRSIYILTRTPQTSAARPQIHCKRAHRPPGAPPGWRCNACLTCHFCRQKTIDAKTRCSRCHRDCERGSWCGSCLYSRVGENIHEARA